MGEVYDFKKHKEIRELRKAQEGDRPPGYDASFGNHPMNQRWWTGDNTPPAHTTGHEFQLKRMFDIIDDWLVEDFSTLPEFGQIDETSRNSLIDKVLNLHNKYAQKTPAHKYNLSSEYQAMFYVMFEVPDDDTEAKKEVVEVSYAKAMTEIVIGDLLIEKQKQPRETRPLDTDEYENWILQVLQRADELESPTNGMYPDHLASERVRLILENDDPSSFYYTSVRPLRYIAHRSREASIRFVLQKTAVLGVNKSEDELRDALIDASVRNTATHIGSKTQGNIRADLAESIPLTKDEIEAFECQWLKPYIQPQDK